MLRRGKLTVAAGLTLALVLVGISLRSGGILALAIPFLMYTGAQLVPDPSSRGGLSETAWRRESPFTSP
jgi:hypothetical protein